MLNIQGKLNMVMRIFLLLLVPFFITSCKTLPEGVSPVAATWFYGLHELPASATLSGSGISFHPSYKSTQATDEAEKKLKPGVKIPAVVHLHGCAGFTDGDQHAEYQDLYLSLGYAVFMPDSFSRPNRERLCGLGGDKKFYWRLEEAAYALKQIRKFPWIDKKRIFLSGFSEGGQTANMWSTNDFTGIIMLGSDCSKSGGSPVAPDEVPVLAIVGGEADEWTKGWSCKVTRTIGGSKSIILDDAAHQIAHYSKTQNAIKLFLKQCCDR